MKRLLIVLTLLLLAVPVVANPLLTVPWADDLVWNSDTLHVTTTEKCWAISTTAYWLTVINPNANFLLIRFSNVAGILQTYLGDYGVGVYHQPYTLGSAIDSIFVDGEAACTVYIEYWDVE